MTYREAIQIQIQALEKVYQNCEDIRDAAAEDEKECWNIARKQIRLAANILIFLDNTISQDRATTKLQGNYIINEIPKS